MSVFRLVALLRRARARNGDEGLGGLTRVRVRTLELANAVCERRRFSLHHVLLLHCIGSSEVACILMRQCQSRGLGEQAIRGFIDVFLPATLDMPRPVFRLKSAPWRSLYTALEMYPVTA